MSDYQAKKLRKSLQPNAEYSEVEQKQLDLLKLPPRSVSMKEKEEKNRPWWKLKYPLIRLLVVLFILLPGSFLYYIYHKSGEIVGNNDGLKVPSKKFEKVIVETNNETQLNVKNDSKKQTEINNANSNKNTKPNSETQNKQKIIIHIVGPGETLYSIAMKYYQTRNGEKVIQEQNHLNTYEVSTGQKLLIPMDQELKK
ncbi:LysM peptidoglycan-binding domain-containing protein [Bacillus sp. RG28]|uniref:LysM peptidoglycan-binding domain-containing protein n=1 Tax=Gottfriedia endophytica TaxID=2820819 RepID=A0A940SIV5_9BACI|nr:LysM peptidoglycan-binding domain-containing protein [Gottfriedia endophytica]MBP0724234.1 LysM peptidoglycan-binding domain-containing protein [Gottfriedia endophytica]